MPIERPAYRDHIIQDREIMAGKPVVKGTRIPVEKVLDQLAYKPDLQELLAIYPELTVDDVRACLVYAQVVVANKRGRPPRAWHGFRGHLLAIWSSDPLSKVYFDDVSFSEFTPQESLRGRQLALSAVL